MKRKNTEKEIVLNFLHKWSNEKSFWFFSPSIRFFHFNFFFWTFILMSIWSTIQEIPFAEFVWAVRLSVSVIRILDSSIWAQISTNYVNIKGFHRNKCRRQCSNSWDFILGDSVRTYWYLECWTFDGSIFFSHIGTRTYTRRQISTPWVYKCL